VYYRLIPIARGIGPAIGFVGGTLCRLKPIISKPLCGKCVSIEKSYEAMKASRNSFLVCALRLGLTVLFTLVGAIVIAWAAGALYFDLPAGPNVRTWASIVWAVAATLACILGRLRGRILILFGIAAIAGWWLTLRPSQNENWQPQLATLAHANRQGDLITVYDIRDNIYRTATDFTPRYDIRNFDLANLKALDLFINYWGSPYMAHPILSFDFGPQGHLCFSIETRFKVGQGYSTLGGLYRQFELIYIAADERDVIRLRTNIKHEDIYLYRLRMPLAEIKERLSEYLDKLNDLYSHPQWYNAVTENCTTSIRAQRSRLKRSPWDWRILVNGYADQMLYERHALTGNLPFPDLKAQALINQRALAADDGEDFSERIRAGLAGF
jgi:hypothetical protein